MAITATTIDLEWTAATDNVGVTEYEIWMDGALKETASGAATTHTVTGLTTVTTYAFHLVAKDAANNSSTNSNTVNCTTI